MRRRTLLAACGVGVAGLAGCTTDSRADETGNGTRTGRTDTAARTDGTPDGGSARLSVGVDALQPALAQLATDSLVLTGGDGAQFLVLDVAVEDGDPPARSQLAFRFDGEEYAPAEVETARDYYRYYTDREGQYPTEGGEGWLVFRLPETGDAAGAGLTWPGGVAAVGPEVRERLSAPAPPLSLEWMPPETVPLGAEPEVGFAVTNEGALPGRFVAGLNRTGPSIAYAPVSALSRLVPPGETVEWTVTDTLDVDRVDDESLRDGEPDFEYKLVLPDEHRSHGVRVTGG